MLALHRVAFDMGTARRRHIRVQALAAGLQSNYIVLDPFSLGTVSVLCTDGGNRLPYAGYCLNHRLVPTRDRRAWSLCGGRLSAGRSSGTLSSVSGRRFKRASWRRNHTCASMSVSIRCRFLATSEVGSVRTRNAKPHNWCDRRD